MKNLFLLFFVSICLLASSCKERNSSKLRSSGSPVHFIRNEQPMGADLDVLDSNERHLFRILLPEFVMAENVPDSSFLSHRIPGEWGVADGIHWCRLRNDRWVEASIALLPGEKGTLILFGIRNLSDQVLEGVSMDICVSVSHIPCPNGAWINRGFINVPEPPDRDSAGNFWYEKVAPYHLKAFINGQWTIAHPHPDRPSRMGVPRYMPFIYLDDKAHIMAVESLAGDERLFQAWDSPCRVRCAFPGNSCMHLEPILAEKLLPGQVSFVRGEVSFTDESWETLSGWSADRLQDKYETMKVVLDKL